MVEFAGWLMPVQYTGIIAEHQAVRRRAGLFDLCHMGILEVRGPGALRFLERVTTNDPSR
ncbi:MAG: glycine cleavage system aminomethyltransferase GcvT, partial [Chloroflexota bacterium]